MLAPKGALAHPRQSIAVGFLVGFWAVFVSLGVLEEINQPWDDQLIGDFWGIRTTLDYNLLSLLDFHCSLKWQPLSPIWTYNLFAQFHSQTASKIIWIKICWLCPMGISQWPYQGRDKRVGFWLLCAYFKKIISSKHWCCGVLAPPPCQLSNCTSDSDLGRTDSYSPGCSLFPLRTPSLHHPPHGSPPTSLQVLVHIPLSHGDILGISYSKSPPKHLIEHHLYFFPQHLSFNMAYMWCLCFVSCLSPPLEYKLSWGRKFCVLYTPVSPVSRTVSGS